MSVNSRTFKGKGSLPSARRTSTWQPSVVSPRRFKATNDLPTVKSKSLHGAICLCVGVLVSEALPDPANRSRKLALRQFAFPQNHNAPSQFGELSGGDSIPLNVAGQLRPPIGAVGFWKGTLAAVPMPVAAVHEDRSLRFGKNKVRAAWQCCDMPSKAQPRLLEEFLSGQFRLGVLAFNAAHDRASLLGG